MEHVMGELNFWTAIMTTWGESWIAVSDYKAYGKMASLFAQPYSTSPHYYTIDFPSRIEILLTENSAVQGYIRSQP
jgi:hypothetical protein